MAYTANHYVATYDDGNNANTKQVYVFAKDDSDARAKILKVESTAQNIVVSSAPS